MSFPIFAYIVYNVGTHGSCVLCALIISSLMDMFQCVSI